MIVPNIIDSTSPLGTTHGSKGHSPVKIVARHTGPQLALPPSERTMKRVGKEQRKANAREFLKGLRGNRAAGST